MVGRLFLDYRNWLLALIAMGLWLGCLIWYFGPIFRRAWRGRHDEFFRRD